MGCPETAGGGSALHRRATIQRITEIAWSAAIASVVTIIVVTSLGWLTTQTVVEKAREQGAEDLVALRAAICSVRFQQRPDALTKLTEFKAISYDKAAAIKRFIADESLATMVGENAPAPGAIDRCAYAINGLVSWYGGELYCLPHPFCNRSRATARAAFGNACRHTDSVAQHAQPEYWLRLLDNVNDAE